MTNADDVMGWRNETSTYTEVYGGHRFDWDAKASPSGISQTVVYKIDGKRVSATKFYDALATIAVDRQRKPARRNVRGDS